MTQTSVPNVPSAAVGRLVCYLRVLENMESHGQSHTDSLELGRLAGASAFQVRKDLAYCGRFGKRGSGYTVALLRREVMAALGLDRPWPFIVMGAGRLGQALAYFPLPVGQHFSCVGIFDSDESRVGASVAHLHVQPLSQLRAAAESHPRLVAVLAVPAEQAINAAETLLQAGVVNILNFTPVLLPPPPERESGTHNTHDLWYTASVENVDFLAGMQRLAHQAHRKSISLQENL